MKHHSTNFSSTPRFLVIIVARIGDTILTTPAIRALKENYPHSKIVVYAHPKRMEVLENLPFIDQLKPITKRTAVLKGCFSVLGKKPYDAAFVYGVDQALVQYALRVSTQVLAFAQSIHYRHPRLILVNVPDSDEYCIAAKERLSLVESMGVSTGSLHLAYQVSLEETLRAKVWLRERCHLPAPCKVGLQLHSFPTKQQRNWPLASFEHFIASALQHDQHQVFIILGDQASTEAGEYLATVYPEHVVVAAGQMTLRESAALLACLDMYVGVDTGPTHIAGALGVPMLVLYHADFPGENLQPRQHPYSTYLQAGAGQTLEAISVDQVTQRFLDLKRQCGCSFTDVSSLTAQADEG